MIQNALEAGMGKLTPMSAVFRQFQRLSIRGSH
jgi:hypothetical protein